MSCEDCGKAQDDMFTAMNAELEALKNERDQALGRASDEKRRADEADSKWRDDVLAARVARDKAERRCEKLEKIVDFVMNTGGWHGSSIKENGSAWHLTPEEMGTFDRLTDGFEKPIAELEKGP